MVLGKVTLMLGFGLLTVLPAVAQANKSLRMTLVRLEQRPTTPVFRVELDNVSDQPLVLNLGTMLANGRQQYPNAIHLSLKDIHGKVLPLELKGPAAIAGRVDPLVVPLPPGATFALPVKLTDYISPKDNVWVLSLAPGRYRLSATYSGVGVPQREANLDLQGISLMPYWIGSVVSNVVRFTTFETMGENHAQ